MDTTYELRIRKGLAAELFRYLFSTKSSSQGELLTSAGKAMVKSLNSFSFGPISTSSSLFNKTESNA